MTSLLDLCASKIVQDAATTKQALQTVPTDLCYSLMKAAVALSRDRSIEVLVAHWPFRTLSLKKFAPPLIDDVSLLNERDYIASRMRMGVKHTTCLAHTYVECLKKRSATKLRHLDLSGYPAGRIYLMHDIFCNPFFFQLK
jgi:hypothetical protein